jgi:hypothetical protein
VPGVAGDHGVERVLAVLQGTPPQVTTPSASCDQSPALPARITAARRGRAAARRPRRCTVSRCVTPTSPPPVPPSASQAAPSFTFTSSATTPRSRRASASSP